MSTAVADDRSAHPRTRIWAVAAGTVSLLVALISACLVVAVTPTDSFHLQVARLIGGFWGLSLAPVGVLILVRRPGNRIGWLTLAAASAIALTVGLTDFIVAVGPETQLGLSLQLGSGIASVISAALLMALIALFPDGHLPSRRWRPVGWAIIAWSTITSAAIVLWIVAHPGLSIIASTADPSEAMVNLLLYAGAPLLLLAVATTVIARFVRSRGVERQQLKWFAYAATMLAIGTAASMSGNPVAIVLGPLTSFGPPIAIAIAVLRYRLYDIDLLINRTLVYGATSAAIAATFFLAIVALQPLLRPFTGGSEIAIAASTLVSFALFQPVRRRIQGVVDRRFDRARYDVARTLDQFADRLRDEVDLDALRSDLVGAVRGTMAPSHASLWLRKPAR